MKQAVVYRRANVTTPACIVLTGHLSKVAFDGYRLWRLRRWRTGAGAQQLIEGLTSCYARKADPAGAKGTRSGGYAVSLCHLQRTRPLG